MFVTVKGTVVFVEDKVQEAKNGRPEVQLSARDRHEREGGREA